MLYTNIKYSKKIYELYNFHKNINIYITEQMKYYINNCFKFLSLLQTSKLIIESINNTSNVL